MTRSETIIANYTHLSEKGGLITPAGWSVLEQYFSLDIPKPYRVIGDFFTNQAERLVVSHDSVTGNEELRSLGEFFTALSTPKTPNGRYYTEIDHHAESMPLHIDTDSGHTFHGNFHPMPSSYYEIYDQYSDEHHLYEDAYGERYALPIRPDDKKIFEITNRQLLIVNGMATTAIHSETGETTRTSVPHKASIPRAINTGRHLLTVYAERPNGRPPSQHPSAHSLN